MNYRHVYHAGNFADVTKHVILLALLEQLQRKDKGYCYLDTHAGVGLYDLGSEAAGKTREFESGIARLRAASVLPPLLERYRALVASFGADHYPGSPSLATKLLRPQDRAVLAELHPEDVASLKALFRGTPQVAVHHTDGYHALKAFLPPKEGRGLVLIDPPYEQGDEFERLAGALRQAHQRWPQGIYALWYPLKDRREVQRFHSALERTGIRKQLLIELSPYPEDRAERLDGSGMVIVNPPWQLQDELEPALRELAALLAQGGQPRLRVEWLVPE